MFTRCFLARTARRSLMVTSFPFGTRRMSSSTSIGAGTTIVPVPQRVVILPSIFPVFGRPLLSASFSRHDFFFLVLMSKGLANGAKSFEQKLCGVRTSPRGPGCYDAGISAKEFYAKSYRTDARFRCHASRRDIAA